MFYNYKWTIAFKNCEFLCGVPETYIIRYIQLYHNFKNLKHKV